MIYGTALPRDDYERMHNRKRSVIFATERTGAGNIAFRIGREHEPGGTFGQTEYPVLTQEEARDLIRDIERELHPIGRRY